MIVLGPVGVGNAFLASFLRHIACMRNCRVRFVRANKMLRSLRDSRLNDSREEVMNKLTAIDPLVVDNFVLESMSRGESKDVYQLFVERTGRASTIVTSNRDNQEWLGMFDDVLQAQSAIDRFMNNAYDLIIDGESYRPRLKPKLDPTSQVPPTPLPKPPRERSRKR